MTNHAANEHAQSQPASSDQAFCEEQEHLSRTYAAIAEIGRGSAAELKQVALDAARDKEAMASELSTNFATADDISEMYAEFASINRVVDGYNLRHTAAAEKLAAVELLLQQPYFAKIVVRRPGAAEPRSLYLGAAGLADDGCQRIVVDWRSPIAEVYYNQSNGLTSYQVDGRTIEMELLLRRQFDIERDRLLACFDTTVAIEDPLLLASLSHERGARMKAITATIQKEQNVVVRHADVPCLMVQGVAGSGKTSVMMQRIAYLLYQNRKDLEARNVHLISPNPLFGRYIADVLPDMGESNPAIATWKEFAESLLPAGRGIGSKPGDPEALRTIEENARSYAFRPGDFRDIAVDGTRLVSAESIAKIAAKHAHLPTLSHQVALIREALEGRLAGRLKSLAATEHVQDEIAALSYEEMLDVFGETFEPQTEEEERAGAYRYLTRKFADAQRQLDDDDWLRIDRVGAALLGNTGVTPLEWIFTKIVVCGFSDPEARYVMIDEMQDYSQAQLMVLTRYFRRAHFLLLGDPNQAIAQNSTPAPLLERTLQERFGEVTRCSLMTSYRSTASITGLFARLSDDGDVTISSVRESVEPPSLDVAEDAEEWERTVQARMRKASEHPGLGAVVVPRKDDVGRFVDLARAAGVDALALSDDGQDLPTHGLAVVPLTLAKGLEFDCVVVPDVSEGTFPSGSDLARRRLYTTVSRATDVLHLVSNGAPTGLLDGAFEPSSDASTTVE